MKEKSRTYNSITNSIWGIASALITVVLNFVVRIVIVRALGEEINGLHNLFQNTINVGFDGNRSKFRYDYPFI